jgi:hypothetical protein
MLDDNLTIQIDETLPAAPVLLFGWKLPNETKPVTMFMLPDRCILPLRRALNYIIDGEL